MASKEKKDKGTDRKKDGQEKGQKASSKEEQPKQGASRDKGSQAEEKKTYYDKEVKAVLKELNTSEKGISEAEAKRRLERYGPNKLEEKEKVSPWKIFLQQFKSPLIWVLIAAMIISVIVAFIEKSNHVTAADLTDAIVIFVILILNAVFGFIQEYKAEKAIEKLRELSSPKAKVIRDGHEKEIDAVNLVSGDIIRIETGDRISADARIIEEKELETQEAALTGESNPVAKTADKLKSDLGVGDRLNCVFAGTVATMGRAKAVVTMTGMDTQTGKIAEMIITSKKEKTPLQKKLAKLGKLLTVVVIVISFVVFAVGMLRGYLTEGIDFSLVKEMLISAIALAVAAIPEGLPAVVTISLALGVRRMIKRNALIRRLPSVETLGATTVICTDKTGTLTHNQMTVTRMYANGKTIKVGGTGYKPEGRFSDTENIKTLLEIGALCNDAKLKKEKKEWKVTGDPTEGALIVSARKAGMDIGKLEKRKKRVDEIGFTSERKRMTTIHSSDKGNVAYTKGAPDIILKLCSSILVNGKEEKLTSKKKKEILEKNDEFADNALRVLGFAYKKLGKKHDKKNLEKDLVFVGLQAMIDPPRKEVKDAVEKCRTAGIRVIMVTGDHMHTAVAIGKQLGIKGKAIEGAKLEKMSRKKLKKNAGDITVYARVDPKHKVKILEALRSRGHVVGMTGDGVNDAPALKKADIGVAMGITGTDVSKEASDMVLTDDNFASIVSAIEEGRTIFDNIRKFVMYLLSSNFGEVLVVFFGILLGKLPILALHILWINIATDGLPALALSVEPPEKDIMKRKPKKKKEGILTKHRFYLMIGIGIVMTLGTLGIFRYYPSDSLEHARTMAFTTLVLFQLFNVLNLQSESKSVFKTLLMNKWLIGAIISSVALQVIILYLPFLNQVFSTVPLSMIDWLWAVIVSASIVVFGELVKLGMYLKEKSSKESSSANKDKGN
ncbi:calcium-translocating P-type ATPase, SERCA-type [Candidatus Woesearchaeota archaeon]|nr:calcium-translocating P-type ATPase, SERCA-type [Candidatus Woesearchaeota archaeon]